MANYESGERCVGGLSSVRPFEVTEDAVLYFDKAFCAGEEPSCTSLTKGCEKRFDDGTVGPVTCFKASPTLL